MRRVYWVCNWLDCRENDMTTLSKDEVVRLAREAGYRADAKMHDHDYDLFLNFYTLCRAPLVAEVERL